MEQFPSHLLGGYSKFMNGRYVTEADRYKQLAEQGQTPRTMIIACCDSRSAPETIFSVGPGELFVVRNVANLVPPYAPDGQNHGTSAALEFAVQSLKIREIVVMGHGRCGGIHAALSGADKNSAGDFIGKWMGMVCTPAQEVTGYKSMTPAERQRALEYISVRTSLKNLLTFPQIRDLHDQQKIALYGAWFDISTGELWVTNQGGGDFHRPPHENNEFTADVIPKSVLVDQH
ncbi:carbonic anhydrase [Allorhizobium pseudoryzae]|uniref:carbonic anhydrase n=1 Tax=Allorhizobium pseudoryzae TaxID=379684 RepID=UPI003CFF580A